MFKSILFVMLVGYVSAGQVAMQKGGFIDFVVVNIVDPFVEAVIENTLTVVETVVDTVVDAVTDAVTGFVGWLFGKRSVEELNLIRGGFIDFVVVNIVDPFVEAVVENTLTVVETVVETVVDAVTDAVTGFVGWLFGKREIHELMIRGGFIDFVVVNIVDPFVEAVIENTLTVVETVVDTVVDAVTDAVTGFVGWLFGKRGIEANAVLSIIQAAVPILINTVVNAFSTLLGILKPLAKLELAGSQVNAAVAKALENFDNQVKVAFHTFLSAVLNVAQTVLAMPQLNLLANVLGSVLNHLSNLTHLVQSIVQMVFAVLNNPFVGQLLGHLLG